MKRRSPSQVNQMPPGNSLDQGLRGHVLATQGSVRAHEIGVTELANSLGAVGFPATPEIAPCKATEHCWPARSKPFSLQGVENFFDAVLKLLGQISETAMTSEKQIEFEENGLPNTFVPGRNLLFFTFAAAIAYRRGLSVLVGGMCETDYSGYPDCRDNTLKALQVSLGLGMDMPLVIETPLMWLDKRKTWELAKDLGGPGFVEFIQEETHTCYLGDRQHRHDWGYGCNDCPACQLRRTGFEAFQRDNDA